MSGLAAEADADAIVVQFSLTTWD